MRIVLEPPAPERQRFRTSMAVTQLALATGLLAVAGLLVVSLVNTVRLDLGITREGLIAFGLSPTLNGYTPDNTAQFFDRLDAELARCRASRR